jgi:transposase
VFDSFWLIFLWVRAGVAGWGSVREASEDRPLNARRSTLNEKRTYRKFTHQQKLELVMASWHGERSIAELCREYDISESLLGQWRDQVLEAGAARFGAGEQRSQAGEQRRRVAELERALVRKTYEREIAGKLLWEW